MLNPNGTRSVLFSRNHGGYNSGESAGFAPQKAAKLVGFGVAGYVVKSAPVAEPEPEEPKPKPKPRRGRRRIAR